MVVTEEETSRGDNLLHPANLQLAEYHQNVLIMVEKYDSW